MNRCTAAMRRERLEFLPRRLYELRIASLCPDKTHEKDLKHCMR